MRIAVIYATTLALASGQANACERWLSNGPIEIRQSNGLIVSGHVSGSAQLANPNDNRLGGTLWYESPTLNARVNGKFEGTLTGRTITLQVQWFGLGMKCDKDEPVGIIIAKVLDLARDCRVLPDNYMEKAIYDGTIEEDGSVHGRTWPIPRPHDGTTWVAFKAARCIDGWQKEIPKAPEDLSGAKARELGPIGSEVTANDKAREIGPIGSEISAQDKARSTGITDRVIIASSDPEEIIGSYDTDFGQMLVGASGGTYEYNGGRLVILRIDGSIVEGTWTENGTSNLCANGKRSGRFRFEFHASGFSGQYGTCDEELSRPWNGRRR